jgi:hypothetical protein
VNRKLINLSKCIPLADAISAHGTSHVKPKLPVSSRLQTKEGFDKTQGLNFPYIVKQQVQGVTAMTLGIYL